jgi:hypothetical protein
MTAVLGCGLSALGNGENDSPRIYADERGWLFEQS